MKNQIAKLNYIIRITSIILFLILAAVIVLPMTAYAARIRICMRINVY